MPSLFAHLEFVGEEIVFEKFTKYFEIFLEKFITYYKLPSPVVRVESTNATKALSINSDSDPVKNYVIQQAYLNFIRVVYVTSQHLGLAATIHSDIKKPELRCPVHLWRWVQWSVLNSIGEQYMPTKITVRNAIGSRIISTEIGLPGADRIDKVTGKILSSNRTKSYFYIRVKLHVGMCCIRIPNGVGAECIPTSPIFSITRSCGRVNRVAIVIDSSQLDLF